jgi:hypothetical protein
MLTQAESLQESMLLSDRLIDSYYELVAQLYSYEELLHEFIFLMLVDEG